MNSSSTTPPLAYSYIRFSTQEQRKGDSFLRQSDTTAAWCMRNGVRLDVSRTYLDLGCSAFLGDHRENPDRHALAAFLLLVWQGAVRRGSFLIIESLDRLTREHVQAGLRLCLELLEKGIRIVQLSPAETIYDDKSDAMALMMMIMELNRGHSQSQRQSDLIAPVWHRKRVRAREDGTLLQRQVPHWIEVRDGKMHLIPDRAATVRLIYRLAAKGYGHTLIERELRRRQVPPFGFREPCSVEGARIRYRAFGGTFGSGVWHRSYVKGILSDRRPVGELQPKRNHIPEGPPVPGYFPAAVSEHLWQAARSSIATRRTKNPGKRRTYADLFPHLVRNALVCGNYFYCSRTCRRHCKRYLLNLANMRGQCAMRSFPSASFEQGILSTLREVDVTELLPNCEHEAASEACALDSKLKTLKKRIVAIQEKLEQGKAVKPGLLLELETQEQHLSRRLRDVREIVVSPLTDIWRTVHKLVAALDTAENQIDARLRLRAWLRRVIASIYLVVSHKGMHRFAAAQIFFHGTADSRLVYIMHQPAFSGRRHIVRPGRWWAYSQAVRSAPGNIDLRNRECAARVEEFLAERVLWVVTYFGFKGTPTAASIAAEAGRLRLKREMLDALGMDGTLSPTGLRRHREHILKAESALEALKVRIANEKLQRKEKLPQAENAQIDGLPAVDCFVTGEVSEEEFCLDS